MSTTTESKSEGGLSEAGREAAHVEPKVVLGQARTRWGEETIRIGLLMCGLVGVLTTFGIVITLFQQTWAFFGPQPMTMDAAVVVSERNSFVEALTLDQLEQMWHPTEAAKTWREIEGQWPEERIRLLVPSDDAVLLEQMATDLDLPERAVRADEAVGTFDGVEGLRAALETDPYAVAVIDSSELTEEDTAAGSGLRVAPATFKVSLWEFFFGTEWHPLFHPPRFGILPLLWGTFMVAIGAGLIAVPLGAGAAIYLAEYASNRTRNVLKPILEILAGVPTVVYGYFALAFITPGLRRIFGEENVSIYNAAAGAIVVGIMILPMIASLCDDAFRAVPSALRQGAYALGATPLEVNTRVVFPAALSGVLASFLLALSRAVGETMAVTIAAGALPQITLSPFESIQTLTAYIVAISLGDTPAGTTAYLTIFAVGMVLFLLTLLMNVVANRIMRRFREEYE